MSLFLIFVHVLHADGLEPVSVEQKNFTFTTAPSYKPTISGNGRYVAFESNAMLTADDPSTARDIYIFDRQTKKFRRVAPRLPGASNAAPFLNATGNLLAYQCYPPAPIKSTAPRVCDVYLFEQTRGTNSLMPSIRDTPRNDGEALYPVINGTGRYVVFSSNGANINKKNDLTRQIFFYDRYQSKFEMISQSPQGAPANRICAEPRMSDDGRYVAFLSAATNLGEGLPPESLQTHVYLYDRWEYAMVRLDDAKTGFDVKNWLVGRYEMDKEANIFVFEARQRKKEEPIRSLQLTDLFVLDRSSGTLEQITKGIFSSRTHSPTISGDGDYIGFVFRGEKNEGGQKGGIVIYSRGEKAWRRVATGSCSNPQMSQDGRFIVFESDDKDTFPNSKDGITNIFVAENPFKE